MESNVRTEPVDVVLGVVGVAIIGPTLGLIKKKKKRRSIVRVVVSRDVTDQATAAELTTKATTALVRSHLLSAGGSLHRLEPEMAEWFMTDQETKAYTTSGSELQSLAPWLSDAGLPFASVYREERLCALAIPPTVSDALELGTPLTE